MKLLVCCTAVAVSLVAAILLSTPPAMPTASSIVTINSRTINQIGLIHEHLIINSDLMMRYSHYLNPVHATQTFACPECGDSQPENIDLESYLDTTDEGLGTWDDVYQDALDLEESATGILRTLLLQQECLRGNLSKLRKANDA